jgi:hypothetical protein
MFPTQRRLSSGGWRAGFQARGVQAGTVRARRESLDAPVQSAPSWSSGRLHASLARSSVRTWPAPSGGVLRRVRRGFNPAHGNVSSASFGEPCCGGGEGVSAAGRRRDRGRRRGPPPRGPTEAGDVESRVSGGEELVSLSWGWCQLSHKCRSKSDGVTFSDGCHLGRWLPSVLPTAFQR